MLIVIPNTFQNIKIQLLSCYRVTWLSGLSTEEAYLLNQDWFFEAIFLLKFIHNLSNTSFQTKYIHETNIN
jgi:hypothetical protein